MAKKASKPRSPRKRKTPANPSPRVVQMITDAERVPLDDRPTAPPPPIPDPPAYRPGNSRAGAGRLASEVRAMAPVWFLPDFLPSRILALLVGEPRTGKSTFGAWLCSLAQRPAILPGQEEEVATALIPRLAVHRVNLVDTLLLDDRQWSMPHDRQALTDRLKEHACDLLWIDPIDSYVGECSENDGQGVRAALEALSRLARDVGCLVMAARHPGKAVGNVCPGSRQWRAVPREIVELRRDPGPPERRVLRLLRDPWDKCPAPRSYHLERQPQQPPLFVLGDAVPESEADTLGLGDVVDRWMVDEAAILLKALLDGGPMESSIIYRHAEENRLRERTVRIAARRLGVIVERKGNGIEHRSHWSLPPAADSGTPAE